MRGLYGRSWAFLAAAWLAGCATPQGQTPSGPVEDVITRTLRESTLPQTPQALPQTAPPEEVADELLPSIRLKEPSAPGAAEPRFDVVVKDADPRQFFLSLVEDTPYNMVVDPAVEGEVSLNLKNVTIDEVLAAVRDVYGFQFRKTSYGYHVLPAALQTRMYQVNYLNVTRLGTSETRVSSGQTLTGGSSDDGGGSTVTASSGSQVSTGTSADFWRELEDSLMAIVGTEDGRTVITTPNAGIVVVRAMPSELRQVGAFLKQAGDNMHRQVILEAKILEVTLDDGFQSGINWAALFDLPGSGTLLPAQTGGGTSVLADGISDIAGNAGILDPSNLTQIEGTAASAFGGVFSIAATFDDFAAFVDLLETQGSVRTLSSPRVSTVNNQKAVIKVGQDEFFVTDVSTTTVTGTATTSTPEIELTAFFSGIALDVTPQISEEHDIILHIHPSISEVVDQVKNITVGGVVQSIPLALSSIRESDSIVRAKSGQVIVIGGLMQNTSRGRRAAVPWLGRIPLVGALFRQQKNDDLKTELVILLRPIVVGPGTWRRAIRETAERVEKLTRHQTLRESGISIEPGEPGP